jgi:hypothetical protein
MRDSPPAKECRLRSYRLDAPTSIFDEALGRAIVALVLVGASLVGALTVRPDLWASEAGIGADESADADPALVDALPVLPSLAAPTAEPTSSGAFAPIDGGYGGGPEPAATAAWPAAEPPATLDGAVDPGSTEASLLLGAEPTPSAEPSPAAPPAAATPAPARVYLEVAEGPTVNLRAEPSATGTVLARLTKDTVVEELRGEGRPQAPGWRYVRWNNRDGWITDTLLRPAPPVLLRLIAAHDQGIDFDKPRAPGVYPLKQLSTGRPIADQGQPVYVNESGARVSPPRAP